MPKSAVTNERLNRTQDMSKSSVRFIGEVLVQCIRIIGTNALVFSAYVPSSICGKHHNIMTHNGQWYGMVGTETLPAELDALPACTDERSLKVRAWHAERYRAAHTLIIEAFPEAAKGRPDMAEIRMEG